MSSRQSRRDRGRKRGRELVRTLVNELVVTRRSAGTSQSSIARQLGCSQSDISRLERLLSIDQVSVVRLCEYGALLGLDLGAGLNPNGDDIVDRGHQELIARFVALVHSGWRVAREVPLPTIGDRRSWDLLLRLAGQIVGIEAETRVRDIQRLTRRIRERQRDGGADHIVVVLSDTATNRRLLPELLEALGPAFGTAPRSALGALRHGLPLPGSAVVMV